MMKILAFSGKKQGGKGTACQFLSENCHLFGLTQSCQIQTFAMASPIKKMLIETFGLEHRQMYGTDADKNSPTKYRWESLPHYASIVRNANSRGEKVPFGFMSGRQMMQQVGTEIFRSMNDHIWVEAWVRDVQKSGVDVALCDDLRFPIEFEAIQAAGGKIIRLTRNPHVGDEHASETALDPDRFDWKRFDEIIDNANLTIRDTHLALLKTLDEWGWITVDENWVYTLDPTEKAA